MFVSPAQVLMPVVEVEPAIAGGCVPRLSEMISSQRELIEDMSISGISYVTAASIAGTHTHTHTHAHTHTHLLI